MWSFPAALNETALRALDIDFSDLLAVAGRHLTVGGPALLNGRIFPSALLQISLSVENPDKSGFDCGKDI